MRGTWDVVVVVVAAVKGQREGESEAMNVIVVVARGATRGT